MAAKHVDDIKVLGKPAFVETLIRTLESHFGEFTITEEQFTNCGIRHQRMPSGVKLDQDPPPCAEEDPEQVCDCSCAVRRLLIM